MTLSPMQSAIARLLSESSVTPTGCTAAIRFPMDFIGFQGHFPGNPVVPAVCLISTVELLAEHCLGRDLTITKVVSAKFRTPILPEQTVTIQATLTQTPAIQISAVLTNQDNPQPNQIKLLLT